MEKIDGKNLKHTLTPEEIITAEGREITLCACVHKIKKSGGFYFVLLRTGRYVYQTYTAPANARAILPRFAWAHIYRFPEL